jgi:hypothetical protein
VLGVSSDQPTLVPILNEALKRRRLVQGGGAEPSGAAEEGEGGVTEHMLLMALESLYKDASEQDVRLGLLRTTLQILQRHGQLNPSPIQVFHSHLVPRR